MIRSRTHLLLGTLLLAVVLAPEADGQTSEPSTLRALRVQEPIRLDGLLDEDAWRTAIRITNFTQRELAQGEPVTERTEVAVLYDTNALYVGFWGFDSEADRIVATRMQRDFSWSGEDDFEFVLDTYADRRTGYLFVTNPNGAKADALITDNGRSNKDWDGIWEVRTRVNETGWFAEIRIPFSTFKFPDSEHQIWGANFERNIPRKREQATWQGWSRNHDVEQVSNAGRLEGIEGVTSGNLLDVRPYGIAGVDHSGGGDDRVADLGVDASYLITPTMKLNLTLNPDFAQVESDRAQVNLTRFSITYPEKRAFFLEGQEFFDFDLGGSTQAFYSRRIGIAPDRTEIPIQGGARLLGRQGATTIGGLWMRTAERDTVAAADYAVVRVRQDVLEESAVGMMATGRIGPAGTDLTWGADVRLATSSLPGEKNLEAGGAVAWSRTGSSPGGGTGRAERLFLDYPNDFVEFSASWERTAPRFDPAVGFLRRTAYQRYASELSLNPRPAAIPWIQQVEVKPFEFGYYLDDVTKEMQSVSIEFVPLAITTISGESFEFNIQRDAEDLTEPFEILEGSWIPVGTYWFTAYEMQAETYRGRPFSVNAGVYWGDFYLGRRTEWSADIHWRTGRHLTLGADFQRNLLIFGPDRLQVDEVGGNVEFAISPELFGTLGAQWNNEDEEALVDLRIEWIPKPGTDLFLVVNHEAETAAVRWAPRRTALLSKLVWRIAF